MLTFNCGPLPINERHDRQGRRPVNWRPFFGIPLDVPRRYRHYGVMTDWIDHSPGLSQLDDEIRQHLVERSRIAEVPEGTVIFGPGKAPQNLLLLLDGWSAFNNLRSPGREIVLYRVHARESCVLTTACLLAYEDYSAEGVAETDVSAVAIPRTVFEEMVARSSVFRRFVFAAFSRRITDLFLVIEEVAFRRIDNPPRAEALGAR